MLPLTRRLRDEYRLDEDDSRWLAALVREWHVLADTSFSDLVLWVSDPDDRHVFHAVAQLRTMTGPTSLEEDVVGDQISYDIDSAVVNAYLTTQVITATKNSLVAGIPVDQSAIPVMRHGRCIAVVECHQNRLGVRAPGALEDAYLRVAGYLKTMIHHARYPVDPPSDPVLSPRIGHGLLVISQEGTVSYASPNSVLALRSLGVRADLMGESVQSCLPEWMGNYSELQARLHAERRAGEFTINHQQTSIRLRVLPMWDESGPCGTVVICRDITQLMASQREIGDKDATIREIHHRVKNNLQTVAALLRLQARRIGTQEGRDALGDAQRRVQSIASVHEILSRSVDEQVDFDVIADRVIHLVLSGQLDRLTLRRDGSFGSVPAHVATPLALILAELCQNAVEHGTGPIPGVLKVLRTTNGVKITMIDSGPGLPEGFEPEVSGGLGLSIVTTLTHDLNGRFILTNNQVGSGACAIVCVDWWAREDSGMLD